MKGDVADRLIHGREVHQNLPITAHPANDRPIPSCFIERCEGSAIRGNIRSAIIGNRLINLVNPIDGKIAKLELSNDQGSSSLCKLGMLQLWHRMLRFIHRRHWITS